MPEALKNLSQEDTMVSKMTSFIFEETLWKLDEFCGEGDGDSVCVLTLEAGSLMTEPPSSCFSVISRVGNLSLREVRDTLLLHSET